MSYPGPIQWYHFSGLSNLSRSYPLTQIQVLEEKIYR